MAKYKTRSISKTELDTTLKEVLYEFRNDPARVDLDSRRRQAYEQSVASSCVEFFDSSFDTGYADVAIDHVIDLRQAVQLLKKVGRLSEEDYEYWKDRISLAERVKTLKAITKREAAAGNIGLAVKVAFVSGIMWQEFVDNSPDEARRKQEEEIGKAVKKVLANANLAREEDGKRSKAEAIAELKRRHEKTGGAKTTILKNMAKDVTGKWGAYSTLAGHCKDVKLD